MSFISTMGSSQLKRSSEIILNERSSKRLKKEEIEVQESVKINLFNLEEFFSKLNEFSSESLNPKERFKKIISICTPLTKKKEVNQALWIEIPTASKEEFSTYFTIDERSYDSQCFQETDQNLPKKVGKGKKYYFISASNQNDGNDYYFQIRIDKMIKIAEIIHIQKAPQISGNEIKNICMRILDFLNPLKIFLNDDSKIETNDSKIILRVALPIVKTIPTTWYESYKPFFFEKGLQANPEKCIELRQPEIDYLATLDIIRKTRIIDLIKKKEENQIKQLAKIYIKDYGIENFNSYTVHQLGNAIYSSLRTKKRASDDYATFFNRFLKLKSINETHKSYKKALSILYTYKIWVQEREETIKN